MVSESRQVSKLQTYKTRPKEFGALEFSAGNGKISFSIGMARSLSLPARPNSNLWSFGLRRKEGIKGMGSRLLYLLYWAVKGHMTNGTPANGI